ncbi:hypothetical protein OSTOST_08965 [Ostertagia ostertagi]
MMCVYLFYIHRILIESYDLPKMYKSACFVVPPDVSTNTSDIPCWDRCRDFGPQKPIPVTKGFRSEEKNLSSVVVFDQVPGASFYVVQFKKLHSAEFPIDQFQNTPLKSDFYSANGTVEITFKYEPGDCDTVEGNPCVRVDIFPAPISKKYIAPGDKDYSLTLNVTFEPIRRENEPPTIYYKAFYGDALPYAHKEEVRPQAM